MSSGMNKLTADRNQKILLELVALPGNDRCADCKARNPRWASHNLGIFICVSCASIHRKIGTHVTKVKSLNLDSWTREQVEWMKEKGNIVVNQYYNPNELRNPPPANFEDTERDSELEQYIRAKYEFRRFIDRAAIVASKLGPSRSTSSVNAPSRSQSTPLTSSSSTPAVRKPSPNPPLKPASTPQPANPPPKISSTSTPISAQPPAQLAPQQLQRPQQLTGAWADLVSLQTSTVNSSLPLQYQAPSAAGTQLYSSPGIPQATGQFGLQAPLGQSPMALFQQPGMTFNPYGQQQASLLNGSPSLTGTPMGMGMVTNGGYTAMQQQQAMMGASSLMQSQMAVGQPSYFQPQPQQLNSTMAGQPGNTHSGFMSHSPNPMDLNRNSPYMSTTPQLGLQQAQPMQMQMQGMAPQQGLQHNQFFSQMMPPGQHPQQLQQQQQPQFGMGMGMTQPTYGQWTGAGMGQQWGGM